MTLAWTSYHGKPTRTHGTLCLVAYRPRPDLSLEERPACIDRAAVGGAPLAPSHQAAHPRPAAMQDGRGQPPQPHAMQSSAFIRGNHVLAQGCSEPLRVECVGPQGVVILVGRNGARSSRRAAELRRCTEEVDPPTQPQKFQGLYSTACVRVVRQAAAHSGTVHACV